MAIYFGFLLILIGLTGIHSIDIVSDVPVKTGASISIPCRYDSRYISHVKYLCKGYYWSSCTYAVKTNKPSSGKFSISDDKKQRIFTVTIKDLTDQDTDYWCIVEINGGPDVGRYFHLSVTRGTPRLSVDKQEISTVIGGTITINCNSTSRGMKWCRLGGNCVAESESKYGTTVTSSKIGPPVFNVTMSKLNMTSSGWYLCVQTNSQMPVHVTVNEPPTTTQAPITAPITVHNGKHSVPVDLKSFIIPLSLLILIMVTLFTLFMLKRHKKNKSESSAIITDEEEITYSTVKTKKKTSGQKSDAKTDVDVDVDVVYSSVVTQHQHTVKGREANAKDAT